MRPYSMSSFHYPAGRQSPQEGPSRDVQQQAAYGAQQSVNLPPISSIDPRQQQQRPSHSPAPGDIGQQRQQQALGQPGPQYASHLPSMPQYYQPSMAAGGQYLGGPAAPMTSSSLPPGHRFPLPPAQDPHNIVPGARPKKDIKRRTKTGCLTCRKRRIKVSHFLCLLHFSLPLLLLSPVCTLATQASMQRLSECHFRLHKPC